MHAALWLVGFASWLADLDHGIGHPNCLWARPTSLNTAGTGCRQAGFRELCTRTLCRNARVDLHKVTEELRQRKRPSYQLLTAAELDYGLRLIEQEWCAKEGQWIDPKPHVFITAVK